MRVLINIRKARDINRIIGLKNDNLEPKKMIFNNLKNKTMQNHKIVLHENRESFLNAMSCTLNSAERSTKDSGSTNRSFVKFFKSIQKQTAFVFLLMIMLILPSMLAAQNTSGNQGNKDVVLPTKFELKQNTPNSLNPTTRIDFAVPTDSKVTIKIFDSQNIEVLTLLNDVRTAGYHKIQFYAPHISSGTYYYSFIAESGGEKTVLTEQMLLTQ